jgi:hypothetical protein
MGKRFRLSVMKDKPCYDCAFWQKRTTYNPSTGGFTWSARPESDFPTPHGKKVFDARFLGKPCGGRMSDGYVLLKAQVLDCGVPVRFWALAHKIAWMVSCGPIEEGLEIDHIDGNPNNNCLSNLRKVTPSQNSINKKVRADNALKTKGVSVKKDGRFVAQINGKHIGYYKTLLQAAEAYEYKAKELHGEFRRTME